MSKLDKCGKFAYCESSIVEDISYASVLYDDKSLEDLGKSKACSLSAISKTLYNIMLIMDMEKEGKN